MRAAVLAALLIAGGGAEAASSAPRPLEGRPRSPDELLLHIERCAGFFVYSAAAAAKSEGRTAEAARRVNSGRADAYSDAALALRERRGDDDDAARRNVASAVVRNAGLYARRWGAMEPPSYFVAVKDVLNRSDRSHCLSLHADVRQLLNDEG